MGWLSRLLGSGTAAKNELASEAPAVIGWTLNEKGFPTLEGNGWRIVVMQSEAHDTPLWKYCAVKNGGIEWSHYAPSEELAKQTAELHIKSGRRPALGIVQIEEADGEYFDIVGESHYQGALESIAGPKGQCGADFETEALLIPEPENQYDPDAIQVVIENQTVGYIPRDETALLHQLLERAGAISVICDAVIEGGWKNSRSEGDFCVRLDIDWPPRLPE